MLKIFTIYSVILIVYCMIISIYRIIKLNKVEERIISFISLVLNCPVLYVLIEMLKMLF